VARELGLGGYVRNRSDGVEVVVCGERMGEFLERFLAQLPPNARIDEIKSEPFAGECEEFAILQSADGESATQLLPDLAICEACVRDLFDPANRRYRYPLINCTDCGPRYTIIQKLPYDRQNTTMAPFEMCEACRAEYEDPASRFYHAQPIGCNECGPKVRLGEKEGYGAIEEAARLLREGRIVAIKGVGGYHLVCREEVAGELRRRKRRSKKPFAVMFGSIERIEEACELSEAERELVCVKERPIVVVKKREGFEGAAPDIDRLGVFLPYSGIYHLLFSLLDEPLIVTSANISDEPIIRDEEGIERLGVADAVLWYDREILRSCDDSVVTTAAGKPIFYRLARGYAPKSFYSKEPLPPILAVGARQKSAVAIAKDHHIILSPHIGDIKSVESFEHFRQVVEDLKRIYRFEPQVVACDIHPGYETSRYARELGLKVVEVQHHRAHVWAALAEMELLGHPFAGREWVGFAWDGTGYGDDGTIWGGEVFVGNERRYHFEPFRIVGGETALKRIDLIAKSLMRHAGLEVADPLFELAYKKGASFVASSVGRLFDAVAYTAGLAKVQEYEGYTGLLIERAYGGGEDRYDFAVEDGVIRIDWPTLFRDEKHRIPTRFLNTLAAIIEHIARREGKLAILTGGVFQNRTLLELTTRRLKHAGIDHYFPTHTPINDGGIALGQVWWGLGSFKLSRNTI
jgi:hydrogenase maturation protein HypF